jgi:DNA processing protein
VADAVRLNRHVMAIPGPVTGSMSQGCLDLLVRGEALLVRGHRDVLDLVAPLGERLDEPPGGATPSGAYDRLDRVGRRVFDACSPWVGRTVAELAVGAALACDEVEAILATLADEGIVAFGDDGWRRCGTQTGPDAA